MNGNIAAYGGSISPSVDPFPEMGEGAPAIIQAMKDSVDAIVNASLAAQWYGRFSRFHLMGRVFEIDLEAFKAAGYEMAELIPYGVSRHQAMGARGGFYKPFIRVLDAKAEADIVGNLHSPAISINAVPCAWPVADVMPGITVIMGDTGSGKTTYVQETLRPDIVLRFGEPVEPIDSSAYVIPLPSILDVLEAAMLYGALGYRVAVDSIRALVYSLSGAAMEGGMSAALFDVITTLNNLMASMASNVVLVVNPLLSDMSKADRLFVRVAASCAGAVHLRDLKLAAVTFRLSTGRVLQGLDLTIGTDDERELSLVLADPTRSVSESSIRDTIVMASRPADLVEPHEAAPRQFSPIRL